MIQCALLGVQTAMLMLVGVVLIKLLVRRTWLALAIFALIQCAGWIGASPVLNQWSWGVFAVSTTLSLTLTALSLAALIRYGVLSLIAAAAVFTALGSMPITFDLSRWYAGLGLLTLALVCALPLFGAWTAVSGKAKPG